MSGTLPQIHEMSNISRYTLKQKFIEEPTYSLYCTVIDFRSFRNINVI